MCYEKYDSLGKNPKIITACGHTFCETCLNKLTHCPKCRKLITNTIINFDILDSSHLVYYYYIFNYGN